ncbi:DNA double-strand break repair nuclease NurA [Methanobacterium aggregans]|uniref:DNA double-strand break repair nuclease NurA n=1 Tax=Methanobacterium aggregans TaxID=1615586 RepID=UPI001AE5A0E7|nr:DNA double-strand break repair nuclease NurA [Methanobacterium aggregans]MBP2045440.1 hypothetical protein [Methanobacterium aggregans]
MLDSLYEKALEKKDGISNTLKRDMDSIKIDPHNLWRDHPFKDGKSEITVSAGDGSYNKKRFMGFFLYAVDAECLIFNKNGLERVGVSDVNVIPPYKYPIEGILGNYMGIFEFKSSLKAFREYDVDITLFDGSIRGNLLKSSPVENKLKTKQKDEIRGLYVPILEESFRNMDEIKIESYDLFESVEKNFPAIKIEAMIYLENIERLMSIGKLLKETKNIVAISKTSIATDYFKSNIPDIAIFEEFCKKQGYTDPCYLDVQPFYQSPEKAVKGDFPIMDEFFKSLNFTVFYARLEDFKNVLKFELPYRASEEEIIKILEGLKGGSAEGYPYLLKKAHNDVVISKSDLERLSNIIGFLEKSGREML